MTPPATPSSGSLLPVGWEERTDATSGALYYFNAGTGESSWTLPKGPPGDSSGGGGWEEREDPSTGAPYWYNTASGDSRWDNPNSDHAMMAEIMARETEAVWEARVDPSTSAMYYFNLKTEESRWERPEGFVDNEEEPQNTTATEIVKKVTMTWEERVDDSNGYPYFFNTETGDSVWEKPQELIDFEASGAGGSTNEGEAPAAAAENHHWEKKVDESSGITYYWNSKTDESVWEKPQEVIDAEAAAASVSSATTRQAEKVQNSTEDLKHPRAHLLFAPYSCHVSFKTATTPWYRTVIEVVSSPLGYRLTSSDAEAGDSLLSILLSEVAQLVASASQSTVQVILHNSESFFLLFSDQAASSHFLDSVTARNQVSTPFNDIEVKAGDLPDVLPQDIDALKVLTREELDIEAERLREQAEALETSLQNMSSVARQSLRSSAESSDDESDEDNLDSLPANRRYPASLKSSGPLLHVQPSGWAQMHAVLTVSPPSLALFSHSTFKKPKSTHDVQGSTISLSGHNALSFSLITSSGVELSFRALSLLQFWEWVCALKLLAEPQPIPSNKFAWSISTLDYLELAITTAVTKTLHLTAPHSVTFSTGSAFGDPLENLEASRNEAVAVLSTNDLKEKYGLPRGSVLASVEGSAIYGRLNFSETIKLLSAVPMSRPMRADFRVSQTISSQGAVRTSTSTEWVDAIIKVEDRSISFSAIGTEHADIPNIDLLDASVHLSLTADHKFPLLLSVNSVCVRFNTFKKLLEFMSILYETVLLLRGDDELMEAIDAEDDSDDEDIGESDLMDEGWTVIESPSKSMNSLSIASPEKIYGIVNELQQELVKYEAGLPSLSEIRGLRDAIKMGHDEVLALLCSVVSNEADLDPREGGNANTAEQANRLQQHLRDLQKRQQELAAKAKEDEKRLAAANVASKTSTSPLKAWKPSTPFTDDGANFIGAMPRLAEIIKGDNDDDDSEEEKKSPKSSMKDRKKTMVETKVIMETGSGVKLSPEAEKKAIEPFGELLSLLVSSPDLVFGTILSLTGDAGACSKFAKVVVRRICCRFTSDAGGIVKGILECAKGLMKEGGARKTRIVLAVKILIAEVAMLDEVRLWGRDIASGAGGSEDAGRETSGFDVIGAEGLALSVVRDIIAGFEVYGVGEGPDVLLSLVADDENGTGLGLNGREIVCELVLLKALKDWEDEELGEEVYGWIVTFLRMVVCGKHGGMTILQMAPLGELQVRFDVAWEKMMAVEGRIVGHHGWNGAIVDGMHFDTSFGVEEVKAREMMDAWVLKKSELYILHASVSQFLNSRGVGEVKDVVGLVKVVGALGSSDLSARWAAIGEAVIVKAPKGKISGVVDEFSETALVEGGWLLQRAKSRVRGALGSKGRLEGPAIDDMAEVLGELRRKGDVLGVMMEESAKLELCLELVQCYKKSVEVKDELEREKKEGRRSGMKYIESMRHKALTQLALQEKALIKKIEQGLGFNSVANTATIRKAWGEAGKGRAANGIPLRVVVPTSPLQVLLQTVMAPTSLQRQQQY